MRPRLMMLLLAAFVTAVLSSAKPLVVLQAPLPVAAAPVQVPAPAQVFAVLGEAHRMLLPVALR